MSDAPDLQTLARRYLDLWQDQMAAVAADPALAEAMAASLAAMSRHAAAFAGAGATDESDESNAGREPGDGPGKPSQRAAAAAAASADRGGDLDDLRRRIGALEERIAVLEAELAATRRRTGGRGGRRRA